MKLIIIGASGHGKVVADIAKQVGYDDIVFLDDNEQMTKCGGYRVVGKTEQIKELEGDVFVAIGNTTIRKRIMADLIGRELPVLRHRNAVIADDVVVGEGTAIMAGAVINTGAVIGRGCIINTCSSVDHDCKVEDYCHVAVGAHLCGTVHIGEGTWIGAGATVINNISICDDCMIGAGAVVLKNIEKPGTYFGIPAKAKDR